MDNDSPLSNRMDFKDFKRLTTDERDFFIFDTLCRVDQRTAALDNKYSKAWVETTMKGLIGLTLTGVVATVLATIGIHIHPGG